MVTTVKSREPSAPSLFGMSTVGQAINLHKVRVLVLWLKRCDGREYYASLADARARLALSLQALTLPLMLCLMYLHGNYTQPAVLYCFIHGIYGMMWLLKVCCRLK
jgi:hypothetical protein